ncbi:MAG: N-acetylneuraminate lyase [Oscillospiraceae bacterium]|nr:N-acetylneuraminate lyase [Oscillospiraceae bacterium]
MNEKFSGIFPALLTPFDKNDEIDYGAMKTLMERLIEQGVSGFYIDGSTAEAFLLSFEERKGIIKAAAEFNAGRKTLIAQIGCISTKQSIELAEYAESCGFNAVSSVAPFYYKFSFEEVKRYYFDIVNAVNIPMMIYNIPGYSGVNFSVDNMSEFLKDERFIGVKHTSPDYFALRQFKTAFPGKIFLNGFDETFLAGLSMGADGAIGSTYNFMPDIFIKIYNLFKDGKIEEAMVLQKKADVIIAELLKYGVMSGAKAILTEMGVPMGRVRAPFSNLTEEQKKALLNTVMPLIAN